MPVGHVDHPVHARVGGVVGCVSRVGWGVYLSIMSTILMPMATDDLLNMVCSDGATCAHE